MKKLAALVLLLSSITCFSQEAYTIVFLHKKTDSEKLPEGEVKKIMDGHMANMERLAKEGKLVAAGPFEGGGGIFIMNTTKITEAQDWISTDPGVQAKRWNVELLPFKPRHNNVCAVKAPYEMVNYTFVRFDATVSKFTAGTYPTIMKKHDDYLRQIIATGNVVSEGVFGEHDGGIVVMKGDVQPALFEQDPGVDESLISVTTKKLYIAKGSFCEN